MIFSACTHDNIDQAYSPSDKPEYIILADECKKRPKLKIALIIGFSILMGIYFTGYLIVLIHKYFSFKSFLNFLCFKFSKT